MKDKLFKDIEMKRPARRDAARGAGVAAPFGRRGWRFAGRVLSLVLTLSLLFNSVSFGINDAAYHTARAAMEGLTLDGGDYVPVEREIEIGGDAGAAYDVGQPGNTYGYIFETEKTVLLSQIFAMYTLPVPMQSVETVMFIGGGDLEDPTGLVLVEPLRDAQHKIYDYQISALQYFNEVRLSVPIAPTGAAYTLVLSNPVLTIDGEAEVAEAEAFDLGDDDAPADIANAAFAFSMEGRAQVRLSDIIYACGMPFAAGEVEMVALAGGGDRFDAPVFIEDLGGDYLITAQEDFGDARLLVYTARETFELLLTNGREAGPGLTDGQDGADVLLPEPVDEEAPVEMTLDLDDIDEETTTAPAEETPTAPAEETPTAPAGETPDEPAEELTSTPVEETPAESVEELPDEPADEQPTEPVEEQPAEPVEEQPAEPVEEQPAEPVEEQPTEPVEEQPTEPVEEQPAEPVEETPTEPVVEVPQNEPGQELPVEPVEAPQTEPEQELPTEPVEEQPTEPVEDKTTEPTDEQQTEPVEDKTTEPTDEQPTEPVEDKTTEPVEEQPTEPVEEQPTEPVEEQPTEPVEEQPTEPVEEQPTEPVEDKTTEPTDEQPTEPVEEQPTEPVEDKTTEPTDEQPTEPVEDKTTEPTDEQPTEPAKDQPTEPTDEQTTESTGEPTTEPVDEPSPEPPAYPAQTFAGDTARVRVRVDAPEGAFPEGTTMSVTPNEDGGVLSGIADAVAEDQVEIKAIYAVDIDFHDAAGGEIEPLLPTAVEMRVDAITESQRALVVHVNDSGVAEIVAQTDAPQTRDGALSLSLELPGAAQSDGQPFAAEPSVVEQPAEAQGAVAQSEAAESVAEQYDEAQPDEAQYEEEETEIVPEQVDAVVRETETDLTFEADAFSTYAVVITEPVPARTLDAVGDSWAVGLTCGADAGIPADAALEVTEMTGAVAEVFTEQAARVLDVDVDSFTYVKVLDMAIVKDGESLQPQAPVDVSVQLYDMPERPAAEDELRVVHFSAIPQVLDCALEGNTVTFEADGFSAYVIALRSERQYPAQSFTDRTAGVTVSVDAPEGAFPEGTTMQARRVMNRDTISDIREAVAEDFVEVRRVQVVDITFYDADGREIEPRLPVSVVMTVTGMKSEQEAMVVHVDDTGAVNVQSSEVQDPQSRNMEVAFDAGTFSMYAVVVTEVIETRYIDAAGNTYQIEVGYGADAGIPSGSALRVSELTGAEADAYAARAAEALDLEADALAYAKALDIAIVVDGAEVQPQAPVKVSVKLLDAPEDLDEVNVLHFGSEVETVDCALNGDTVDFETDGFSVYVITGINNETVTPQCTYKFMVPNADVNGDYTEYQFTDAQGNSVFSQTVTSGDELIVPQMKSTESAVFAGWYRGERDNDGLKLDPEPYNFDNITITENSAITLYAVYTRYATVIFHDRYDSETDTFPVAYTQRVELTGDGGSESAQVKITDLDIENIRVGDSELGFLGWSETPVQTPGVYEDSEHHAYVIETDTDGCITVTGDKSLYPIFKQHYLLTFYAAPSGQGAAYNGPVYLLEGEALDSLPTTSVDGYTFTGWYTGSKKDGVSNPKPGNDVNYGGRIANADGSLIAVADDAGVYVLDGKLYMRADTTLYAKWEATTTADYKILYWKQNGTGSDYVYAESIPYSGTVGTMVSVANADMANNRYPGYHLKETPASAEVKADGSTVLNVYYDHNEGYTPQNGDYTLTFADSVTEAEKASPYLPHTEESVAYGASLAGHVIENPASGRRGYEFDRWYLDPYCTKAADLETMKMPDQPLTLYAGWKLEWYFVSIDPNYGELRPLVDGKPTGSGSTWFWQTVEREPIAEYSYVERNYVPSSSGTWYYVGHLSNGVDGSEWPDRYTYYTQDPSLATEDTTFEYLPGAYTYAGWYEVLEDGTEVPYADFGERTDRKTTLRLHWKKNGTYYLAFDAGEGTLEDGTTKEALLDEGYADYAEITLTRAAQLHGYTFVGWQVRDSEDDKTYAPGQVFTLHADDAKRVGGKDVVYLDAVYARVDTAGIVYDANGGTVADSNVDFGQVPDNESRWIPATGTIDTNAGTATVSGLANNSTIKLSSGEGFIPPADSGASFLGWSDKKVCDDSATFYDPNSDAVYGVNYSEPRTLYAVWGARVTYNHGENAEWGSDTWNSTVYALNDDDVYSRNVNIGNAVAEPTDVPVCTDGRLFRYWATRTGSEYAKYDFSQPVTGALDLYAYWSAPDTVIVHAVDASSETLVEKSSGDGWTVTNVRVSTEETELNGNSYVTAPEDYAFAFAAVAENLNAVSESNAVTAIKYEDKEVKVKYSGESSFRALDSGSALYFVYYQKKARNIGYKSMAANGVLTDAGAATNAPATTAPLGEYDMSSGISGPLTLANGFTHYAFAIGSVDPGNGTEMNASNLSLITDAKGGNDPAPTLRIRNTWRGFQYTTQTGDDAAWTGCGYDPQLYVIYYDQTPTVVLFHERTVGSGTVMETPFTFNLVVTQVTTTTKSVQTQIRNGSGEWEDSGAPTVTTMTGVPETVFDTAAEGNPPYILKNGETNSAILFYSASVQTGDPVIVDENTQTITTTTTTTAQTAVITQTEDDAFTTKVKPDDAGETEDLSYTCTADGTGGTKNVTFTNAHKSLPVEVHVAMVESDGDTGGIVWRDTGNRSEKAVDYKFDLALGGTETLLTRLDQASVFEGDTDTYAFGTVMYGTGSEGNPIAVGGMGVASVSYAQIRDNVYELVLKDSDGNIMGELGGNQIYYLYYPMAKIRYIKEAADGSLTDIRGCLANATTGSIEESDSVTYGHESLTMNGKTVTQHQSLEIPLSGLVISQSGNKFRMPPVLDDGVSERYLSYVKLGAGNVDADNISALDTSAALTMQLKVQNNTLQYSFDGSTWKDLPLNGTPTIYAIYTERGYDLQISKAVDTSQSGRNAIFTDSSYTVTIESPAIKKSEYKVDGYEGDSISVDNGDIRLTEDVGTITLNVEDGTRIRIKGLEHGVYTVTESGNDNYTLTAKSGPIVGGTVSAVAVEDNTTVSLTLDTEKKLDLTNSPKAICKIDDHYFYTLRSMVEYVNTEITDKTAKVEMLTDYVMPKADTVEIPGDFELTFETVEEGFSGSGPVAVITRTDDLADVPLFTSSGKVTFKNIELDGNNVVATAPMIQSAGDLTIDAGATIIDAKNNSTGDGAVYGGAINATKGDITVNGSISECSAENGGAIYYTGNGTISLSGQGKIQNNTATAGDGGAIYMTGGTLALSGNSTMSGNTAESGKGGAVYAATVLLGIDQGAVLNNNTASEGGAVYIGSGTVTVSNTEGYDSPEITRNTATSGNGGAFCIGTGSISIAGGTFKNNTASSGNGGAVYAGGATVAVSDAATLNNNTAKSGGAVYANTGAVTVTGGTFERNTATTGNGGAVCAASGTVALSGPVSMKDNTAASGNGGAVCAAGIDANLNQAAQITGNEAGSGGAIYATSGTITLSASKETTTTTDTEGNETTTSTEYSPTVTGNRATTENGGAIWLSTGSITVSGGSVSDNEAQVNGGAFCTEGASFTLSSVEGCTPPTVQGNNAKTGSGGAIYATSGTVTVSAGTMTGNSATGNSATGNGGALYAGSGAVTIGAVTMTGNSATGNGGAAYVGSGTAALSSSTMSSNTAANGAAVFVNTGRASFSAGTYTNNVATTGGAVGMGSTDARLTFSGNVQIKDNKLGTADNAPKSNVYLDQDSDAVLNFAGLDGSASIGIYVPDTLTNKRGVPGARFGSYTSDSNIARITNDRYEFSVQKDTATTKLYWGKAIQVQVRYLESFDIANNKPPMDNPIQKKYPTSGDYALYYPEFSSAAISELATELYNKYSFNPGSTTAVYAVGFVNDATAYADYITNLTWNSTDAKWTVTKRDNTTEDLGEKKIIIYYAEPAYINIENNEIENNEPMKLTVSNMTVNGTSVINNSTVAGYGTVFAKNGSIRTALLPVTAEDLQLEANQSVTLLIPGGRGRSYTLDGSFDTQTAASVRLRRGASDSLSEETVSVPESGTFDQLTGMTLTGAGTYQIIFGDDRAICKVRRVTTSTETIASTDYLSCVNGVIAKNEKEYLFTSISQALNFIKKYNTSDKKGTVEMLVDYLLPASDKAVIPRGYDITITTASTGVKRYVPVDTKEPRATISRDTLNTGSMIESYDNAVKNDGTVLRLDSLIIDGKAVVGNSDGGAVKTRYCNVYVDTVDFKNVYALNGGALYVIFETDGKIISGTELDVKNSNFIGCNSTKATGSRLGGGAIHTSAKTLTLTDCTFDSCQASDQAGAVFHRVEGNYESFTTISGCAFNNCRGKAAGGLELDSKTITVTDTHFTNCAATERNGGGFNVFALNKADSSNDSWVTLEGCTFTSCQANNFGGGFRSTAVYTKVMNCTFTNTSALGSYTGGNNGNGAGGAIGISNANAKKAEIYACTITGCTANGKDGYGGGIYYAGKDLTIGDTYTSIIDNTEKTGTMSIMNCTSKNAGGGIYHSNTNETFTMTNAAITGNTTNNSTGGGVDTRAKTVTITGGSISNNTAKNQGGGLYSSAATFLEITGTTISDNDSTSSNGGGVYYAPTTGTASLTVNSCTIENNTAVNGNGGGIYTSAGPVTIGKADGYTSGTVIQRDCTAKSGGGIYQENGTGTLTLTDATVSGCRATNGGGGGIRTNARSVTLNGATVSGNNATSDGGGLWYYGSNDDTTRSLTVNGSTVDGNTSGGNGGGIYTLVKTVTVDSSYTVGTEPVNKAVSISDNKAANGGGIYHSRNYEGSALTVTGTEAYTATGTEAYNVEISGNTASGAGGGVYANVQRTGFTWAAISGNKAVGNGGGVCDALDGSKDYRLSLDHTSVTGNTSDSKGGGIYTLTQLYLKNASMVTGNRLNGSTVDNAAGVYLQNNRTLYVGSEDATEADTSSVTGNYTASSAASNLRLWWNSDRNHTNSIHVYCGLSGTIGVVNAAKVGTQFGDSEIESPDGFSDDDPVFVADTSTLHGIIDRTDSEQKKIIWAGPPIAKITDGEGNLLYLKQGTDENDSPIGTSPAIFDRLYEGAEDAVNIVGAFNVLNNENLTLYCANGNVYTGTDYCVKMLVAHYTSNNYIYVKGVAGRNVTFTTAGTTDAQYPAESSRARVSAGSITKSFLSPRGNLKLENIVIDGSNIVRVMWYEPKVDNSTVTLGLGAVIQNGKADNGAGVRINQTKNTSLKPTFEIQGGVIRNCTATSNGGAVYMDSGTVTFNFVAGNITGCTATGSGGGVFQNTGTFNMSGGTISGCSANNGGGVLVPDNKNAPFNMSGGSIVSNTATSTGGGIAVNGTNSRIYFSGKVAVSGNKATNGGEHTCNVELNKDSNAVINTNKGGLKGGSYIGVYVPDGTTLYDKHGVERKPFGTFANGDSTTNLYSFVNDRNGFKGGIIEHPAPNTIYWIKIFSLEVSKKVVAGESTAVDPDELFLFKVNICGNPSVSGQLAPAQIDSETGSYGDMVFKSNGRDTTTAVFALKDGESVTGVNLSEGLDYEIIEYLIVSGGGYDNQHQRYAAMPMNGYSAATETLTYDGTTYTVIKANTYASKIGENKSRTDVDPYTSAVPFTNLMPVCKITDSDGNLLYRRYTWKKTTNKTDEQEYYYAPAVYTELTGDDGAFTALEGTLYTSNGSNPGSYAVSNGVKVQMLIEDYKLRETVNANQQNVTLTTASESDERFPKQDSGTTSKIMRAFRNGSMLDVSGDLTLEKIRLDGAKASYTVAESGGIANVKENGKLTIGSGAILQNSKTDEDCNGGAVYVASGGTVTMTGGTVNKNESVGDGAGIYLAEGGVLNLSGNPSFGGKGIDAGGNITYTNGNWKDETLRNKRNGGAIYNKPRQDIFIAGYAKQDDEDTPAESLVITGDITSGAGTIWVWAAEEPHYYTTRQFAKLKQGESIPLDALKAFRNAQDDDSAGNDTGSYLHGVTKDGSNVLWNGKPVCKLTDDNDALLYECTVIGSSKILTPAVYSTVAEGFEATTKELYRSKGNKPYAGALKLKMLQDYTLGGAEANITYSTARNLTFTTAEVSTDDLAEGDTYIYTPASDAAGDSETKATLTKDQDTGPMFTVEKASYSIAVTDLLIDGNSVETGASGGIFAVNAGKLVISEGAKLFNAKTTANGGAVYVAADATMEMNGGEISGNTAAAGAGVYLTEGATLELSGSPSFGGQDIQTTGDNKGDILGEKGNFVLRKDDGENDPFHYTETEADRPTNGQKPYPVDVDNFAYKVRQDIYVATDEDVATSIVVTGALDVDPGSIWVWAEKQEHYEMLKQFAVFKDDAVKNALSDAGTLTATLEAFRNAQDDVTTSCGADYLTGQEGEDIKVGETTWKCIYWTGGFDFVFRKIDGDGNPLTGATFTLFKANDAGTGILEDENIPGTDKRVAYQVTGSGGTKKDKTATSGQGTEKDSQAGRTADHAVTIKVLDADGTTVNEAAVYGDGLVVFDKIPPGTYFLVETVRTKQGDGSYEESTGAPKVDPDNTSDTAPRYRPVEDMYRIDVHPKGDYTLYVADNTSGTPVWSTTNDKAPTTSFIRDGDKYKAPTDKVESTDTVLPVYTVMNVLPYERKVALRKADVTKGEPITNVTSLAGARFHIFRADLTEVTDGQPTNADEPVGYYESGKSGVYFMGKLPFGTYYLVETAAPTGYEDNNLGKVFKLTVGKDTTAESGAEGGDTEGGDTEGGGTEGGGTKAAGTKVDLLVKLNVDTTGMNAKEKENAIVEAFRVYRKTGENPDG